MLWQMLGGETFAKKNQNIGDKMFNKKMFKFDVNQGGVGVKGGLGMDVALDCRSTC